MPKVTTPRPKVDQATTDAYDAWRRSQAKLNTASKQADRNKTDFVTSAFAGDHDQVELADGRVIARVREARSAYRVPDKTITRYIELVQ